jgi:hypothetical protein
MTLTWNLVSGSDTPSSAGSPGLPVGWEWTMLSVASAIGLEGGDRAHLGRTRSGGRVGGVGGNGAVPRSQAARHPACAGGARRGGPMAPDWP